MSAEGAAEGSQGQARSATPLDRCIQRDRSPERAIEKRDYETVWEKPFIIVTSSVNN